MRPYFTCLDFCIDWTDFHHKVASPCISGGDCLSNLVQLHGQVHFIYLTWLFVDWNDTESHISPSWPENQESEIVCESESSPPDSRPVWKNIAPFLLEIPEGVSCY